MPPPEPTDQAGLLALLDPKGKYRARLNTDATRLLDLRETFEKLPGHRQAVDVIEIEAIAHRLAGSAGTFGFAEIGAAAITLEDTIILARDPAAMLEWSAIASGIDRIVTLISATRS